MPDVPETEVQPYSGILRSLAAILSDPSTEHVVRLSVSLKAAGVALAVVDLARRIGHEYGVTASSHMAGHTLTVSLERAPRRLRATSSDLQ